MHLCALQVDLTSLYIWKAHSVSPWCVDFCCCCWDGPGEDISFFNKQKIEGIICYGSVLYSRDKKKKLGSLFRFLSF